ncbi:MFS transporter [Kineococcus sp. T90]|nr:MFS transporter [Kineococcus indalonis]
MAVAALTLPVLASTTVTPALLLLASLSLGSAVLVAVFARDPRRSSSTLEQDSASPYRTPVLWRIHAASALLIVPQFTVSTFSLVFLVGAHHFDPATAGRVLACAQIAGACTRLLAGWWSDRVASRLRLMRTVALTVGVVTVLLSLTSHSPAAVVVLVIAAAVTVAPNGLAFTAVAEHAGRSWSGRALGIQNTAQNAVAFATPPVLGALIGTAGHGPAFLAVLPLPLLAAVAIPVRAERSDTDSAAVTPSAGSTTAAGH